MLRKKIHAEFELISAAHDGYDNLGIVHQRTIVFVKSKWILVIDQLSGAGIFQVDQNWHIHPQIDVAGNSDEWMLTDQENGITIIQLNMEGLSVRLRAGEKDPIQGWASSRYANLHPAPVLQFSGKLRLPAQFVTGIILSGSSPHELSEAKKEISKFSRVLELEE